MRKTSIEVEKYFSTLESWAKGLDPKLWLALQISSKSRLYSLNAEIQDFFLGDRKGEFPPTSKRCRLSRAWNVSKTFVRVVFRWLEAHLSSSQHDPGERPVVFKTFHLENDWIKGVFKDRYFGKLPAHLKTQGYSVLYLVDPLAPLRGVKAENSEVPFVSLYRFLPIGRLILTFLRFLGWSFFSPKHPLDAEIVSGGTFLSFVYYECYAEFFGQIHPRFVFYTFENNPWERMLVLASGEHTTIGVQHVPAAAQFLNYFCDETTKQNALPSAILTLGKSASRQMIENYGIAEKKVVDGRAFKFGKIAPTAMRSIQEIRNILVVLGVKDSAFLIHYFARYREFFFRDYEVTFRFHPAYGPTQMGIDIPSDYRISRQSLDEDLSRADVLFYWGSAVAFDALNKGLPLVYLFPAGEKLSRDQLADYSGTKLSTDDSVEPSRVLVSLKNLLEDGFSERQTRGLEHLKESVTVFDPVQDANWIRELLRELEGRSR